ncbi:MAG TPA: GNAT family N-acyltransferase [Aliidongia sp.]|nr:GNAT family N-acyltransferase [Aliidongia sp.]
MAEAARHTGDGIIGGRTQPSIIEGIRAGDMEVRLARTEAEIVSAQKLRYRIFYEELSARPTPEMARTRRDFDRFDEYCDHLLVLDHGGGEAQVVGTYRLLRRSAAERNSGFYTATEFDISPLSAVRGEIMELGRACTDVTHRRNRATMQLLWRGIGSYAIHHDIKIMFGCGSLPGTDPQANARPLSYLYYNHLAPEHLRARALPGRHVRMDLLPPREVEVEVAVAELEARATLSALPPLIKGYLRMGGYIGDGAVIDPEFQTTDVCIIVVTDQLTEKYFNQYFRAGDIGA